MSMTGIKYFAVLFFIFLTSHSAWSQSVNLECYKYENEDNKISEINGITFGWSSQSEQASMLFVKDKKNKNFISELDCPLFPTKGICGLGEGGEIEIFAIHRSKNKIILKISGLVTTEVIEPEGYTALSIIEKNGLNPRYILLNKVGSQNCEYEF